MELYYFEKVQEFKLELQNLHKKYQRILQNNGNRLEIFQNKLVELCELEDIMFTKNPLAFRYIQNDLIEYKNKLHYKINREVLKNGNRYNVL